MRKKGFTLIEILIVIAILAILVLASIFVFQKQLMKARDGKRKADLSKIAIVLEDYYNDHEQYPASAALADCGGDTLKPYLNSIPCDPKTKKPYCYVPDPPTNRSFRLFASLEDASDPTISEQKCNGPDYCGYESECVDYGSKYNYGIASTGVTVVNPDIPPFTLPGPSQSPVPLPSSIPGTYGCRKTDRICRTYDNPTLPPHNCMITWSNSDCDNTCATLPSYGLCDD